MKAHRNENANMRVIISVLDTPEQTHAVGSPVAFYNLAWEVVGDCTEVEDDSLGLVRLDNLPVRARACQVVALPASCR
jgi:hypothetical protein